MLELYRLVFFTVLVILQNLVSYLILIWMDQVHHFGQRMRGYDKLHYLLHPAGVLEANTANRRPNNPRCLKWRDSGQSSPLYKINIHIHDRAICCAGVISTWPSILPHGLRAKGEHIGYLITANWGVIRASVWLFIALISRRSLNVFISSLDECRAPWELEEASLESNLRPNGLCLWINSIPFEDVAVSLDQCLLLAKQSWRNKIARLCSLRNLASNFLAYSSSANSLRIWTFCRIHGVDNDANYLMR